MAVGGYGVQVLQGLLRRFYSAQMESLAEREVRCVSHPGRTQI